MRVYRNLPDLFGSRFGGHSLRHNAGLTAQFTQARCSLNLAPPLRIVMAMLTAVTHCPPPAESSDIADERALVGAAARGEVHAFETLYRRHAGRVHGVIMRLVGGHRARAEDLTQEAFVRAWQALPAFRFESAFSTWLHRLAVNTALMELRSRRSRPHDEGDDDAVELLGTTDSAGHTTALSLDLERAVATLPPRARAVLVLYDVEGWKHEEIAAELGMAVGSSKAQLHRARGLLRTRLGGH
jgi:RNA polymerase sigma factor (sigma-70 family)